MNASLSQRLKAWFKRHQPQLRLTVRVVTAGVLAHAVGTAMHVPLVYWATFSAVIVMQGSIGGSMKAAIDRFLGTAGGAAYGGLVGTLLPQAQTHHALIMVAACLAPTALLAAKSASFRVAPVTALIVVFGNVNMASLTPLMAAIDRVYEISLGSVVGILVSLVVLPARAQDLVGSAAKKVLMPLAEMIQAINAAFQSGGAKNSLAPIGARILSALTALETTVGEARRERKTYLASDPDPSPFLRTLQRLRGGIVILSRAAQETFPESIRARLVPHFSGVADAVSAFFIEVGAALESRAMPPELDGVIKTLDLYAAEMVALREAHVTNDQPVEVAERVFAISFGLQQIRADLIDLRDRAVERVRVEA